MMVTMPLIECSHCGHGMRSTDAHARYKANDKNLPKRCRDCGECDAKYGSLPPTDD
jgi:hypothetical protein